MIRSAQRAVQNELASASPRVSFICASCRRAAIHRTSGTAVLQSRSFASTTDREQQSNAAASPQQQSIPSAPQTHYDFFPSTFPQGTPPKSPFTPDLKQLHKEFLRLQAKSHPDLAPFDQKRHCEALSARINEAYKTLQDPLKRAQYLLSLRGIDVEDESAKLGESELLMEVMEAREAVEEVESEEQLVELRAANNERIDHSVSELETHFAKTDLESAANEAVRLRYWMNIEESIQGWEKGKGGGVLHH